MCITLYSCIMATWWHVLVLFWCIYHILFIIVSCTLTDERLVSEYNRRSLPFFLTYEFWVQESKALSCVVTIFLGVLLIWRHQVSNTCWQDIKVVNMLKYYKHSVIDLKPGNCFLMDFSFVRGPPIQKEQKVNIISSFDGCTSYILITDHLDMLGYV